jgi:Holliday junction resolvase RusA-like endonuclease
VVITFTVPGAPQGKGRPRIGKVGPHARMFTPAKTVVYENLVAQIAQQAMQGRPLLDEAVRVSLSIDCQVPASWSGRKQRAALAGDLLPTSKPDVDNVVKAIFDGCNGVLWRDDVLVVDLSLRKRYSAVPGVLVQVFTADVGAVTGRSIAAPRADLLEVF